MRIFDLHFLCFTPGRIIDFVRVTNAWPVYKYRRRNVKDAGDIARPRDVRMCLLTFLRLYFQKVCFT